MTQELYTTIVIEDNDVVACWTTQNTLNAIALAFDDAIASVNTDAEVESQPNITSTVGIFKELHKRIINAPNDPFQDRTPDGEFILTYQPQHNQLLNIKDITSAVHVVVLRHHITKDNP